VTGRDTTLDRSTRGSYWRCGAAASGPSPRPTFCFGARGLGSEAVGSDVCTCAKEH
jgi:hypothetical protein